MKTYYPIQVVLSLTTGYLLCNFSELHECAELVAGHDIWDHEFAEKALWVRLREALFAQHPSLRDAETFDAVAMKADSTYLDAYVARAVAQFGATVEVARGTEFRNENPLESARRLMGDKPIVIATTKFD